MNPNLLTEVTRRLGNMVFRAVLTRVGDDQMIQTVQVSGRESETRDGVHHLLPYGLSSSAPTDGTAETVVMSIDRGHQVALPATHRPSRVRGMAEGDTALNTIHDDPKAGPRDAVHRLHLFDDGEKTAVLRADVIELRCGDTMIRIDRQGIHIKGDIVQDGAIAMTGGSTFSGDMAVTGNIAVSGGIDATEHILAGGANSNHHSH